MLVFSINSASIQESNIFLRKLWAELNQIKTLGWYMYPYKKGNLITIGTSTLGEISYDYAQKGCIKNLYIDNANETEAISAAVQNAKDKNLKKCSITLELRNGKDICISENSFAQCKIFTQEGKVFLSANYEAYSSWDAEMYLPHKFDSILSIIYEYTHVLFSVVSMQFAEDSLHIADYEDQNYNYDWMDFDECPKTDSSMLILPRDCLRLISYVLDDMSYDDDIELLLNSSRLLMTTKKLLHEIDFPDSSFKADIINSMVCSSFEPLSLILDKSSERCKTCGNLVFSIIKKIKKMCDRYLGKDFSKYICEGMYKNRSVFLHTGEAETTQRSSSIFCPQISLDSGIVMMPHGLVYSAFFDYSSFLFRSISHDFFNGNL